jgi:thiol-disulfide isomerase/thioredoxin
MRPALVALAVLWTGCVTVRPAVKPSPLVGRPAELAGQDLAGGAVSLSDAAGKVRVVDFWATWCDPCIEQLPVLDRLHRELGPRGLAVYAVAVDEEREAVRAFLVRTPVGFPVLFDPGGDALATPFQITRLPTTLVVDRRGIVRGVHLGFAPGDGARLEEEVLRLLGE